jgi:hypothetical protein
MEHPKTEEEWESFNSFPPKEAIVPFASKDMVVRELCAYWRF